MEKHGPPPIILGLWPMAGVTSIGVDDQESIRTIHAALDCGITWFDTAYGYGYEGRSDRVLNKATHGGRQTISVIGKVGQRWNAERKRIVDGSPDQLRRDAEESLKRTGQSQFRYLLLHQPDPQVPVERSAEALAQLKHDGLAEAVGICNATLEQMTKFAEVVPNIATQFGFNMVQQQPSASIRRACVEQDIYGLAYWVLMKGMLAGKMTRQHVFVEGDSRPNYPIFQTPLREPTHQLVDRLSLLANELNISIAALVVAWSVRQLGVTSALVGALHPEQIKETAAAQHICFTDNQLAEIDQIIVPTLPR